MVLKYKIMQKIGEFIYETDQLLGVKSAFVPASAISGGGNGGAQQPQGGQEQQGQPQGDPSQGQGGQPQPQGGGQSDQMMQQVMQMIQQLPPEVQGEAQQALQQVQQLPPEQQGQALQQIAQGIQEMTQQGGQQPGQAGQPQGAGQPGQTAGDQVGSANPEGHVQAENQLDNTKVTLTVRELMDLTSGGSATKSLLAVKQLADTHNQKMQANQQKAQQTQQQAQAEQAAAAQGMQGGGGLYAQAPDASGKMSPGQGQSQPQR